MVTIEKAVQKAKHYWESIGGQDPMRKKRGSGSVRKLHNKK